MSNWKLVVPEATTNLFSDPSFALADPDTEWDIAGDGAPDTVRGTLYSAKFGFSYAAAALGGGTFTTTYQTITTANESYTLSAFVQRSGLGTVLNTYCQAYFDSGAENWDSITHIGNNWYLCIYTATSAGGALNFGIYARETNLRFDGCQLENLGYRTTYCDGDQPGCSWDGGAHTSTSTRSAMSRAGGRVYDLEDDFSFEVVDWQGWGVPSHLINLDSYAILPGAQVNSIKTDVNVLTLVGYFQGTTMSNLHTLRQALVEELAHDRYPATTAGWQPFIIRYTGATVWKEAFCFYDAGLEGSSMLRKGFSERIPVRFLMADPFWYEIGNSSQVLDTNDSDTFRYCAGRLTDTGQWDDLDLTNNPGGGGSIFAVCVASDQTVYYGGNFTNWDQAGVGGDYIIRYDPEAGTWGILVGANDVNGIVYTITEGPDGMIYIGGAFTAVNGNGNMDYIVAYNPATDAWSNLSDPDNGGAMATVRGMGWDSNGNLYIVGLFTGVDAVANTEYIAMWDGTNWNAVGDLNQGAAVITAVYAVCCDSDDNVYVGGDFDNGGGDADADGLAVWDGTSWSDVGGIVLGGNQNVYAIAYDPALGMFLGGDFINAGGEASADYIFKWNGSAVEALGGGVNNIVRAIEIAPDNILWVTGDFTLAGDLTCYQSALWNGSAWVAEDAAIGDSIHALDFGPADPVVNQNYNVYLGTDGTTTTQYAGDATATNDGTASQAPIIVVDRDGGSSAILVSLRNETTGKQLYFRYDLLDGETLTIDCRPGQKSIVSSMFGSRPDIMRAASDFGAFTLQPGGNVITCLVYQTGGPTITGYLLWRDAYRGMD